MMCKYVAVAFALLCTPSLTFAQQASEPAVTFAKDVAPILQKSCQECHRPGQMAPMSLLTYEDVRPWARAIKARVAAREMPPWHMDRSVGIKRFANDPSLTEREIDTIVRWVDTGAPLGDRNRLPPPREWPNDETWRLAEMYNRPPDHVVRTPAWTQPAVGADVWWNPKVTVGLGEERWIRAVEVRPSLRARRVIHHANSSLAEFAPGKAGEIYPEGVGKRLPAETSIQFDLHFHSVGEEIDAVVEVGLWFYPKGYVPKHEVRSFSIGLREAVETFDLPPNQTAVHHGYYALPKSARILSYQPHMHTRGKAMSLEAIFPDGHSEILSSVDRFNFNWQINYVYADDAAPLLPKGTILHVTAFHDNTVANKLNPDATQWVGWGERSYDEMYHAHMRVIDLTEEEYQQAVEQRKKQTQ